MNLFGQLSGGACPSLSQYASFPAICFKGVSCLYYRNRSVYGALQRVLCQIEERVAHVVGAGFEELHGIRNRCDLAWREVGLLDPYGRCEFHQIQRRRAGQVALRRAT